MKLGKLGRVAQVVQERLGLDDSRARGVPEIAKDLPQLANYIPGASVPAAPLARPTRVCYCSAGFALDEKEEAAECRVHQV